MLPSFSLAIRCVAWLPHFATHDSHRPRNRSSNINSGLNQDLDAEVQRLKQQLDSWPSQAALKSGEVRNCEQQLDQLRADIGRRDARVNELQRDCNIAQAFFDAHPDHRRILDTWIQTNQAQARTVPSTAVQPPAQQPGAAPAPVPQVQEVPSSTVQSPAQQSGAAQAPESQAPESQAPVSQAPVALSADEMALQAAVACPLPGAGVDDEEFDIYE